MRKALTGAVSALIAGLAGCSDAGSGNAVRGEAAAPDAIQNQLAAMPEGQRNGVFIRAIRDSGQQCQHVDSSEPAGEHQGFPVWNATCSGGGTWTIVVMNDGTAAVLNADETRLLGSNQAAPQQAQGQ